LHFQKAYQSDRFPKGVFPVAEILCEEVLSLPIHTEMNTQMQDFIIQEIKEYFQ
jgi:dTDP-4-amino-4,6-dideoxygalactose transaminase